MTRVRALGRACGIFTIVAIQALLKTPAAAAAAVTPITDTRSLQVAVGVWCESPDLGMSRYGHISTWDTGSVTSMSYLFGKWREGEAPFCSTYSTFNESIGAWNTSSVEHMDSMFTRAGSFDQDLSGWDTSRVTYMRNMFFWAKSFNQDISGWDTSRVLSMYGMFCNILSFNQDISAWNIKHVTDMTTMFASATAFNQVLCWDLTHKLTPNMFVSDGGGTADLSAPKCQS